MNLVFKTAEESDLIALAQLLADDKLGTSREDQHLPLNQNYLNAFQSITIDPNNELIVVVEKNEVVDTNEVVNTTKVVGMLQLTYIPYLTHIGSWRCLIEGVRIHSDYRSQGLGSAFFKWAIQRAKEKQCSIMQLTSDKQRPDAIRFYETLGFRASHEGFKLKL